MPLKNLIIIFFFPACAYSQSATFYADTSLLWEYVGQSGEYYDLAMETEWIIKGKSLRWGSPPVEVSPAEFGVDSIFFRLHEKVEWDTLICRIKSGSSNTFVYNACCNYFDVIDHTGERTEAKVNFQLMGSIPKSKKYLGTIDANGVLLTSIAQIISPIYRSPMFPNSYNVAIQEIRKCAGKDCLDAAIQRPDGSIDVSYHYQIVDKILSFQYLPVSEDPIEVLYDVESGKVVVR
jgi:hypothetical protein